MQDRKTERRIQQSIFLCIDAYERGIPAGRLYSLGQEQEETFDSLLHCLQKIEQALDGHGDMPAERRMCRQPWRRGRLATLEIRVLFRQRDSWQGIVTWVEGERQETFGSVWDLIRKLDEILSRGERERVSV